MSSLKKKLIVICFILIFGASNSYSAAVTQIDKTVFADGDGEDLSSVMGDVVFNNDGTKMFTSYSNNTGVNTNDDVINEYTLSVPYDISSATYAGASERCAVTDGEGASLKTRAMLSFSFSDDGMKIFVAQRGLNNVDNSFVNINEINVDTDLLQNGTNSGPRVSTAGKNNLQGLDITNDGTKMFLTMNDRNGNQSIKQYNFATPYDLTTITIDPSAIVLQKENPFGIFFGNNGKRLFVSFIGVSPNKGIIEQYTLDTAYDLSSFTLDGQIGLEEMDSDLDDLINVSFSKDGLKMFAAHRQDEKVFEYDVSCPFTIIEGKCASITFNSDRTGIAEAQIELAKRTIN